MAFARVRRWLFEPVWLASPPRREEWACPTCGRSVWRSNPAWKGIWFAPTDLELRTRCARQHGAHGRGGEPLPAAEPVGVVDPQLLAGLASADRWIPVVDLADGAFVALLPPSGVLFVAADGGYDTWLLDELRPSDLVGRPVARGRRAGHVEGSTLVRSAAGVDAASIEPLLGASAISSAG